MMNHYSKTVSAIVALFFVCLSGRTLADEAGQFPSTYEDDLYHCLDPTNNENPIRCDPTTYMWDLGDLNPSEQPDESLLCQEIVKILVRARAEEHLDPGREQAEETQHEVELWETIMETSVVDQLEPCILWAMSFGALTPYAESMGLFDERPKEPEEAMYVYEPFQDVVDANDEVDNKDNTKNDKDATGDADPMPTMSETYFDPFMIALAWTNPLGEPFSLNRKELRDITGRHVLDALAAELGDDKVDNLALTVTSGLPDYDAQILPLTLSGKVVFKDHLEAWGSSNLQKVIFESAFVNDNARDLYLFRLKISQDHTLQTVSTVVAGKEAIEVYALQEPNRNHNDKKTKPFIDTDLSAEDEGFVSKLLIAILAAVGAAILAVICFAYILIFRSRTSGKAIQTLEENSSTSASGHSSRNSKNAFRQEYKDGVPAVKTAPTDDIIEEEESQYDIEYMAGSNDGVSEYDMDTLPPPSALPDSDDDHSVVMSVIEGFDDENVEETIAGNTQSDDSASLYSYIPTDTSLSKEQTALEKIQNKGVLWSVEKQQRAPMESDLYSYDFSTEQSYEKKITRSSILGPSDDDSHSRDSNSLLYGTDDDSILNLMTKPKLTEIPLDSNQEAPPPTDQQPPVVESVPIEEEAGDKKKKFEDLWKDENEIDEAASVLNYLDSVQSARRAAETDENVESEPTSSLKIIDVATPVQTPERPPRPEDDVLSDTGEQLQEALVDMVPATNVASEDNQMNLPLPATLDTNFQDTASVSSSISGSSSKQRAVGESARTKTPSKWAIASPGEDNSVRSSDSSKLRSLLGQGDMNDAALFGKKLQEDDGDSPSSTSTNDVESNQLKSLLTTESKDTTSDDEEDFLFNDKQQANSQELRRKVQEEKKDSGEDDEIEDDEEDRRPNYLPAKISPRNQIPSPAFNQAIDDTSVYSALSDAPSVDETIASNMGWF